jgi:hypothetical protein
MNQASRFVVPYPGPGQIAYPGQDGVKTAKFYVFRSVTGRALNPNKGR